jgi:hypothetical protein
MRCDSVLSRLRRSVVSKPGERAPPRDTGDARPGGLEKDRGDDDAEKCICGGILSPAALLVPLSWRRSTTRRCGAGSGAAAFARDGKPHEQPGQSLRLQSQSVAREFVMLGRCACMAQKQTTHQSLHEPGDTWTSCRPAARAERAAVRQSQEQSNRFSLQCG